MNIHGPYHDDSHTPKYERETVVLSGKNWARYFRFPTRDAADRFAAHAREHPLTPLSELEREAHKIAWGGQC